MVTVLLQTLEFFTFFSEDEGVEPEFRDFVDFSFEFFKETVLSVVFLE
jgi:hypothetical protein